MSTSTADTPATDPAAPEAAQDDDTRDVAGAGDTFADLDAFVATRRCAGLALSPDARRLVTTVSELAPDRSRSVTSLWEIDVDGRAAPRRLTRSDKGESGPVFTPAGDLLFTSRRADPAVEESPEATGLWLLPARGGEARPVLERPGGVGPFAVARRTGHLAVSSPVPVSGEAGAQREAREKEGVSARLHTGFPVRFWDHDLGPGRPHVHLAGPVDADEGPGEPTDLAPGPDDRLGGWALHPSGTHLALVLERADGPDRASLRRRIELLEVDSGEWRVLADEEGADHESPVFSPDGRWLLWVRERHPVPGRGVRQTIRLLDLEAGTGPRDLAPEREWTVRGLVPAPAGDAVYVVVDASGHAPVHRIGLPEGNVVRLTAAGAYSDVVATDDGATLFALRSAVDAPPTPVRLDTTTPDQEPTPLRGPTEIDALPGTLAEVEATAVDGTRLRSWLVLPEGAADDAPAPLVLWIHGGPLSSWNAWSWRWNPWLMAAHGYAVLLPDPRLSTGYGQRFVDEATGAWGELPYTDLLTLTDAALERGDLDPARTAAMGGSFGGYMANWVAGHTDRFDAVVTHASIWHLEAFAGATDASFHWVREWGDPLDDRDRYDAHSPHRHLRSITTPMLVIHGDRDYRVPIGEGLRLWYDLQRAGVESQFLYYPDENHWVLGPGDAKLWYRTVLAFLDHHVRGEEWTRPELV